MERQTGLHWPMWWTEEEFQPQVSLFCAVEITFFVHVEKLDEAEKKMLFLFIFKYV